MLVFCESPEPTLPFTRKPEWGQGGQQERGSARPGFLRPALLAMDLWSRGPQAPSPPARATLPWRAVRGPSPPWSAGSWDRETQEAHNHLGSARVFL